MIDGDRWLRLPGASVKLASKSAISDSRGVAQILVPKRRPLRVTVSAPGYGTLSAEEDFRAHRKVTLRLYRTDLQWPLYGATDSRTQAQVHIQLRPPFHAVWARSLHGLIEFPAVVSGGVAYIGNARATVRAISMADGSVLWSHPTPHAKMASSPAVVGSTLVYHDMRGRVWILDRASGRALWKRRFPSPIESSPIVVSGVDYFGTWDGRLYALDLKTRRLKWSRSLGAKITASAAISGGTLYIGDYAGRLWALALKSGKTRWVGQVNGRIYGTSAISSGRVFVPSSNGDSLTAFSTSGRELWRFSSSGYVYSSPAAWEGRVFVGSYNGLLSALAARSGKVLWSVDTGGPISGAAVVVSGVVYAGSFSGQIFGVDAKSGRVLLRFKHGHYVPVSGDGGQLLFHGYSTLFAMQPVLRKRKAATPARAAAAAPRQTPSKP